jgi:hypothetical protein
MTKWRMLSPFTLVPTLIYYSSSELKGKFFP